MKHTTTFITKLIIILWCGFGFSQNEEQQSKTPTDSVKHKQKYGLRVGLDISKPIRSVFDDDYSGLEIMGDYRLTKRWYLAAELGNETKKTNTNILKNTTKGSYIKAGADYNLYKNWYGMENMIYTGLRVGFSAFSQTREGFTSYTSSQYWGDEGQFTNNTPEKFDGLSAIWAEVQLGIKVEIFNNLYVGLNTQLKYLASQDQPTNFENLYIPGYNRTYDSSKFGFGYGYNISYLIPLYKKGK